MLKDDRDKLSAMFEHHSEIIDNAANIHTVDLTYFAGENQVVGDFNTIDFADINNYTTLNAIYNKTPETPRATEPLYYGTYEGAIKELRKILKAFLYESSVNDWPIGIDYKDNILIGNIISKPLSTEEKYSNYPESKLHAIMNYMFANDKTRGDIIPTYGINGLFYYTSDCNLKSPIQSRAVSYPSEERSNVLYHIHLLFHDNFIHPISEQSHDVETIEEYMNIVDKALTDEAVAQCPFMFCINTTEIPIENSGFSIYLYDNMNLPRTLEPYELTAIINDVEKYEYDNYMNIKPWAKKLNVNGNDIVEAYIYLPSECGIKHIVIENNQITQIVKV